MKMRIAFSSAVIALAACLTIGTLADLKPKIEAAKIREYVKKLASDEFEGRGTGQKGGDAAADWIAKQFESFDLKPGGENGTFFQEVPMMGVKTLPSGKFAFATAKGVEVPLKYADEIVTNNEAQSEVAEIDAPIVFVGFGITAPEYKWDDYKGTDLKGKVALLFVNEPESNDEKFFKGKALTYYGRWTYKYEETARRGAVATLIIHRTDLASYGWDVVRNSWGTERSYLRRDGTPKLQAASWIQLEVARKLVGMSGLDLDKLYKDSQSREFQPTELPVHFKAHLASSLRPFVSRNVVAKLEGSDAKLKDEAILYTAHYDHFGIDTSLKGDQIYNGAVDNATGSGILVELARVWAKSPAPKRSILFAAVTAEEQGLLGSEYFGKHPTIPASKISLDLNYDALAPLGEPEEVEVSGAERTTFYPAVEAAAKQFKLRIKPDAQPGAGHYYRSDHFSLARVGIPSFSINEGMKFKGHDTAWGEAQAKDYNEHRYHQVTDEFREGWNFDGLGKMTKFGYELGMWAADRSTLVDWQKGDEFEGARKASFVSYLNNSDLFAATGLEFEEYPNIIYPPLARQTRTTGEVKVHVAVSEQGVVKEVQILAGLPLLIQGIEGSIKDWKFKKSASPKTLF
ncbi:MAG TPA: M28 family peptidase [Candidatus Acidoferrum sp.]|nr:M28 family peptidase [Candidatus Acidoferrum sp.]